jgi:hypothetical protein
MEWSVTMPRPVQYNPPEPKKLDRFAHEVCREMGSDFRGGEIAEGLANFMKVLTRAYAKDLNRKQGDQLDNDHKTA